MAAEGVGASRTAYVPDADSAIHAGSRKYSAVAQPADISHDVIMSFEPLDQVFLWPRPQFHDSGFRRTTARDGQLLAVGRKTQCQDMLQLRKDSAFFLPGHRAKRNAGLRAGQYDFAIGCERQGGDRWSSFTLGESGSCHPAYAQ